MPLAQGIPLINNYQRLTTEDIFLRMEKFSDNFIKKFTPALEKYPWVIDPFHQWSRQWEYAFAYSYLEEYLSRQPESMANILDAGAGITFFPYYIISVYNSVEVTCLDTDSSLSPIYEEINSTLDTSVEFKIGDIQRLAFDDNHFNVIYCVSVLEHITNIKPVLQEFYRVLKPGGLFIITFDISFDTDRPIPLSQAVKLIELLEIHFQPIAGFDSEKSLSLLQAGNTNDILTTEWIRKTDPDLLPWRRRLSLREIIGHLIRFQIPRNFANLTCFCEALIKV
jgi:SAM-dependent methyltransferase